MTEPFASSEFQGEPDLPHYLMTSYDIAIDWPNRYVNLSFLVEGPVRMVAIAALSVAAARVLAARMQRVADQAAQD